MFDISHCN